MYDLAVTCGRQKKRKEKRICYFFAFSIGPKGGSEILQTPCTGDYNGSCSCFKIH